MALSDYVNTFGQQLLGRYGERVHKLAINAGFTCPNRDGSKGRGGCTFCNNSSFSPNSRRAHAQGIEVTLTAIDGLEGVDVAACEKIARDIGVKFRRRVLDVVG